MQTQEHVYADGWTLVGVELSLDDRSCVVFACAVDGDSTVCEPGKLEAYDMQEFGHVEVGDAGQVSKLLPGSRIREASMLVDGCGVRFGVAIKTSDGRALYIYNWGDDLFATAGLPDLVQAVLAT